MFKGGYTGRILHVDLSKGRVRSEELDKKWARIYIGGRGFNARILWDQEEAADPFLPENVLVFATGPLTGTPAPASRNLIVGAKSPLTGIIGYASAGGHWGPELKFAGYDMVVIKGKASKPVFLWIQDQSAAILDARDLWGKTTSETTSTIKQQTGDDDTKVAAIGQAGENLVKFASVTVDVDHSASRTGVGAVMGAKKLKAIAVRGHQDVKIADGKRFFKMVEEILTDMSEDQASGVMAPRYGTSMWLHSVNEAGALGTRNFQTGVFEGAERISGEKLREEYLIKERSCFNCPVRCERCVIVTEGEYAGARLAGPEYATLQNMGARCGNDNLASIIKANELCNDLGLDTYSTGGAIAFAMECYERGIITEKETDGIDLDWGNQHAIIELIQLIASRKGIGKLLSEGTAEVARQIGKGTENFAICIKDLDYPSIDPRVRKDYGFGCVTSNRGADHLYGQAGRSLLFSFSPKLAEEMFGTREVVDPLVGPGKGRLMKWGEEVSALNDMMGVCKLAYSCYLSSYKNIAVRDLKGLKELYASATGIEVTELELAKGAERVINLERAYNIREKALGRKDDNLPQRILQEPMPEGPNKGSTIVLEPMLDEYYEARGWDKKTGWIPRKKFVHLGLNDVATRLCKLKRCPK